MRCTVTLAQRKIKNIIIGEIIIEEIIIANIIVIKIIIANTIIMKIIIKRDYYCEDYCWGGERRISLLLGL